MSDLNKPWFSLQGSSQCKGNCNRLRTWRCQEKGGKKNSPTNR